MHIKAIRSADDKMLRSHRGCWKIGRHRSDIVVTCHNNSSQLFEIISWESQDRSDPTIRKRRNKKWDRSRSDPACWTIALNALRRRHKARVVCTTRKNSAPESFVKYQDIFLSTQNRFLYLSEINHWTRLANFAIVRSITTSFHVTKNSRKVEKQRPPNWNTTTNRATNTTNSIHNGPLYQKSTWYSAYASQRKG